jgi:hypothetical protein
MRVAVATGSIVEFLHEGIDGAARRKRGCRYEQADETPELFHDFLLYDLL